MELSLPSIKYKSVLEATKSASIPVLPGPVHIDHSTIHRASLSSRFPAEERDNNVVTVTQIKPISRLGSSR